MDSPKLTQTLWSCIRVVPTHQNDLPLLPNIFQSLDPAQAKTIKAMFSAITKKYPELKLVIAWNQPMLTFGKHYVFGVSAAKKHILFAPWSTDVIEKFTAKLKDYDVKKKTISVPNDWKVDEKLLQAMVKARLLECKTEE